MHLKVSCSKQGYVYVIKNTVKTVMLLDITI